jgi:NAD(P)-dependent dehydrogenase (short-subunit alcohol dehydrogenase family)
MTELLGKTAVVGGGSGAVGEGIVRHFLQCGLRVIVPVRDNVKAQGLKDYTADVDAGELICEPAYFSDPESGRAFVKKVSADYGPVNVAVATMGGWFENGPLHTLPYGDFYSVMGSNFNTHFIFAREFMSLFHSQGSGMYVNINGSTCEELIPGAGIVSVIGAAQKMMTDVLFQEAAGSNVRVYEVALFSPVITRSRGLEVEPSWVSAEQAGEYIIKLYNGLAPNLDRFFHKLETSADI